MATLRLYNYAGKPNTLQKTLGEYKEVSGYHYDRVSTMSCEVELQDIDSSYNYAYSVDLNKYFFVKSQRIEQTNITRLYLTIDVLMTYKDEILSWKVNVIESNTANTFLSTRANVKDMRLITKTFDFPNEPFNETGNLILITLKGK